MRKIKILVLIILTSNILATSQTLTSSFSYAVFYNSESGPYLETYMSIIGKTAVFVPNENNKLQSTIEISMIFKQNGEVITYNKYNLKSPEIEINDSVFPNYVDLQRIKLNNGIYNFELSVKDINSDKEKYVYYDIIQINIPDSQISMSGIQFVESYSIADGTNMLTKNGYDLVPYISSFFPENLKTLNFYCEIYNSDIEIESDKNFLIKYYIENANNKFVLHDFSGFKRQNPEKINIIFSEFNIDQLTSGNYNLVIEVRDKENKLLSKQYRFFQRSAPSKTLKASNIEPVSFDNSFAKNYTNTDTLIEYINCLAPIADINEKQFIKNQVNSKSLEFMQQFFHDFWIKRNPVNPELEWDLYYEQVKMVNNLYSTRIYKGYETDRGRIYLSYGAPNNVIESKHEPSAYPYEIWHYYKASSQYGEQINVKFVFYNPELIGDYSLLHSTAKGEIYDSQWERRLSKRNNTLYNFDLQDSDEQIGSQAKENFNK
ncbi:MAG: GWxTD domain-containing protein [Bacteroidota bacterium]